MNLQEILNHIGVTSDHINYKYLDNDRIKKDDLYMQMAILMSKHSHDANTGHGVIAVKNNAIIACGTNGFPRGSDDNLLPNQRVNGDSLKLNCINHAEMNMIYDAAKRGISLDGATVYLTGLPCQSCARSLVSVGITNWIVGNKGFKESEQDALWRDVWVKMFNVNIRKYNAS